MTARTRRTARQAGLLATLGSALISLSCATAPTRTVEPAITTPWHSIASIDTEDVIQTHRGELEALADLSSIDDIERGGVIIQNGNRTRFIEIHNTFRDGPDLIDRYANGEYELRNQVVYSLQAAIGARSNCEPSCTCMYLAHGTVFTNTLDSMRGLRNKEGLPSLHHTYGWLALHTTYMREPQAYDLAKAQGRILFHVHTHNDNRKHETPPAEDPLRPSRQDLLISESHEGIVSGVDAERNHRIYHTANGSYRFIRPDRALSMR